VLLGASYLGDLDLGQGVLGAGPINGDSALAFRLTSDGSEVTWSQSIPGESSDPEASVLCRSALELPGERVALVSSFTGTLAAPWQLDAQGASDALIATFEADGEPGWWRVIAGSEHAEATAALASGSRLAVVGRIAGQLVRPGGAREAWLDEVEALGGPDGFIAVLDTSGELQWARRIGGEGQDWLTELAIDDAGNYWATGHFEQSLPIGTQVLQSDGAADAFLVGFTPTGEVLGASHLAGSGPSGGVAIDVLGDTLLVVGQFEGELTTEADSFTSQGIDTVLRLWSPP
jgi:hypothetical protein